MLVLAVLVLAVIGGRTKGPDVPADQSSPGLSEIEDFEHGVSQRPAGGRTAMGENAPAWVQTEPPSEAIYVKWVSPSLT